MKMKIKELVGILTLTAILGGMSAVGFAQADDDEFNIEPEQPAVEPAV